MIAERPQACVPLLPSYREGPRRLGVGDVRPEPRPRRVVPQYEQAARVGEGGRVVLGQTHATHRLGQPHRAEAQPWPAASTEAPTEASAQPSL